MIEIRPKKALDSDLSHRAFSGHSSDPENIMPSYSYNKTASSTGNMFTIHLK
jgi:hypothetical protein